MTLPQTLWVSPDWVRSENPLAWLTPAEYASCLATPSKRRRADKIAGRLALKRLLAETFDIDPQTFEIGSEGPAPALRHWPGPDGLCVSLSHSGGWGAASWAWVAREGTVGIDIQEPRPVHPRLCERILAPAEHEIPCDPLLLWALKEAGIKALRQPWGRSLREIVVSLDANANNMASLTILGGILTARYARHEGLWLARAILSPPRKLTAGPRSL